MEKGIKEIKIQLALLSFAALVSVFLSACGKNLTGGQSEMLNMTEPTPSSTNGPYIQYLRDIHNNAASRLESGLEIPQFAGYTQEQIFQIVNSSRIVNIDKGSEVGQCSANIISVGSVPYLSTAAHCFETDKTILDVYFRDYRYNSDRTGVDLGSAIKLNSTMFFPLPQSYMQYAIPVIDERRTISDGDLLIYSYPYPAKGVRNSSLTEQELINIGLFSEVSRATVEKAEGHTYRPLTYNIANGSSGSGLIGLVNGELRYFGSTEYIMPNHVTSNGLIATAVYQIYTEMFE